MRLKTLRTLFGYHAEEGYIDHDPIKRIKDVEEDEDEPVILTDTELKLLLAAPNQRTFAGFRDYVLMTFLLDSFLRINSALSVTEDNFDFDSNAVTVKAAHVKNRKSITLPLDRHTVKLIRELLAENDDFNSDR